MDVELRHPAEAPSHRGDQGPSGEQRLDHGGSQRREHHAAARRCEGRRLRPDVRDVAHGLGGLLDCDVEGLVPVENRQRDRLVESVEEGGRHRPEGDDDRQLRRERPEPERPYSELVAAVRVTHGPRPLDEDGADPVRGALRNAEVPRQVGQAERPAGREQVEDPQCGVDAGGGGARRRGRRSLGFGHGFERCPSCQRR